MNIIEEVLQNLYVTKKLVTPVESLVGKRKSVKCIIDSDQYQLTSNGLHYLKAINCSNVCVYNVLYEQCLNFNKSFGFGSEELLFLIGCWSDCYSNLIRQGVPIDVIKQCTLQLLNKAIERLLQHHCEKHKTFSELIRSFSNTNSHTRNQKDFLPFSKHCSKFPEPYVGTLSKKSSIKFSRYSRHVAAEMKEARNWCSTTEELVRRSLKSVGLIDDSNDDDLWRLVCKIITLIYNEFMLFNSKQEANNGADSNFALDSSQLYLEVCQSPPICGSQVFSGVLVLYKDVFFNDFITTVHGTSVNILLVNTIAYGDHFKRSDQKTAGVDIKEIIKYNQIKSMELDNEGGSTQGDIVNGLEILQKKKIKVIFYRGELVDNICEYCKRANIILIPVEDYEVLHRISIITNAEIYFNLRANDGLLSEMEAKTVRLSFLPALALDQLVKDKKSYSCSTSTVYGYIQIHNNATFTSNKLTIDNNRCWDTFLYTILVYGRGADLQHLQLERLTDSLKRIEHFLKFQCFCMRDHSTTAEERIARILKEMKATASIPQELCKENYITPIWLEFDVKLFRNIIGEQMLMLFECFHKGINCKSFGDDKNVPHVFDVLFQTKLWRESLYCVTRICSTLKCIDSL